MIVRAVREYGSESSNQAGLALADAHPGMVSECHGVKDVSPQGRLQADRPTTG
jgi:hypothetical protein